MGGFWEVFEGVVGGGCRVLCSFGEVCGGGGGEGGHGVDFVHV